MTSLLFTDLVGSTALLHRVGEAGMEVVRRAHFSDLREAVAAAGGHEVKNLGDGLMVAFDNPSDAVACAAAMMRAVERRNRRSAERLAIRIGIDVGETTVEHEDYFGGPVVVAKRLCDAAAHGEVLVSDLARLIASPRSRYPFAPSGPISLKGVPEPVFAASVLWDHPRGEPLPLPSAVDGFGGIRTPFVGRVGERAELQRAFADAATGHLRVVCVTGEPGVGKTRLASEFARDVARVGAIVLAGRASEDVALPYQPIVEALRHYVLVCPIDQLKDQVGSTAGALARLVPEVRERIPGSPVEEGDDETARLRLFDAVASFFVEISLTSPLVLILDELQWADRASLLLLRHVFGNARSAALLVLVTYRETDVTRSHPLADLLEDLHREHVYQRLTLHGLDESDAASLVRAILDCEPSPPLVEALVRETDGNTLFLEEIVRDIRDATSTRPAIERCQSDHGSRRLDLDEYGVPDGVKEVLWQRLRRLSPDTLDILRTAAVAGTQFDLDELGLVLDRTPEHLVPWLDEAVKASLVAEAPAVLGRYAFIHTVTQHVLYEEHTLNARARLHGRVGAAIEQLHADAPSVPAPELPRIAHHFARAGPAWSSKALTYALAAGESAMEVLAYEDAERQFSAALRALDTTRQQGDHERARALVGLAAARRAEGDPVSSRAACLEAAAVARRIADVELIASAAFGLALPGAAIGMDFGRLDEERVALLEEALTLLPEAPTATRLRALVHLVLALHLSPLRERRLAAAAEAVDLAARMEDPALRAAALAARHSTQWGSTPMDERLATSSEMARLAEEGHAPMTALEGRIALAIDRFEAGDLDAVREDIVDIAAAATTLHQPFYQWYSSTLAATIAVLEGRYADGRQLVDGAIAASGGALGRRPQWGRIALEFVMGWDLGTLDAVEVPLLALQRAFPDQPVLRCAVAHLRAELGVTDGGPCVDDLLDDPTRVPEDGMWLFTLALLAEVCRRRADADAAARVYTTLLPAAGRLVVVGSGSGSLGAVDRSLGLLALTAGRHDAAVDHLRRANKLHERIGAAPWAARTSATLAIALAERAAPGDRDDAPLASASARAIAARLGARGLQLAVERTPDAGPARSNGSRHHVPSDNEHAARQPGVSE